MILNFFEQIKKFVKKTYDFIFPTKCLSCKKEGEYLCKKCLKTIPMCKKIQEDWIISIWDYKNPLMRKILWLIKFKNKHSALESLKDNICDVLLSEFYERQTFENFNKPILIPIPMSKDKIRKRGFNQTEIIAEMIYQKNKDIFSKNFSILKKIKKTSEQNKIKQRNMRFENISGSFAVTKPEVVKNQNIIIVDDITTTHATLIEAKKELEKSGARKIIAFTIAH